MRLDNGRNRDGTLDGVFWGLHYCTHPPTHRFLIRKSCPFAPHHHHRGLHWTDSPVRIHQILRLTRKRAYYINNRHPTFNDGPDHRRRSTLVFLVSPSSPLSLLNLYTRVLNYPDVIALHHSSVLPLHEGRAYGHPTTLYTCPKRVRERGRVRRWGLGFGERGLTQRCLKGEVDGANDRYEIP